MFIAAVVTNDVTVVLTSQSEFQFLAGNNSLQVTCNKAVNLVSFLRFILYSIFVLLLSKFVQFHLGVHFFSLEFVEVFEDLGIINTDLINRLLRDKNLKLPFNNNIVDFIFVTEK